MNMLALAGPTGIGKTELAAELARRLPAEIVAVDSMQVYRGLEIGTGKPPARLREEIPHHGLDLAEPAEEFDVLRYVEEVSPAIREIERRGKWVLLVAGCGLYLRVLLRGLCGAPGGDAALRERLRAEGEREGWNRLHARLREVDPEAAVRIHPNDAKRMIRALEVYESSGRPISQWQSRTEPIDPRWAECPVIGLECEREWLYRRIEERVDGWLADGWLEETRNLLRGPVSRTAREALGYRELFEHLEGDRDWDSTRELIRKNSRRYARRQWSWFRGEPRVRWVRVREGAKPAETAAGILSLALGAHKTQGDG